MVRLDDVTDVLLLDGRTGTLSLCSSLLGKGTAAIILVAAPDDDHFAAQALDAGVRGILPIRARADDMVMAIRLVSEGQIWARRRVLSARLDKLCGLSRATREMLFDHRLSLREREVFSHAASGLGNKQLAHRLAISESTVKVHLSHIFQKLGLHSRAELAAAYHGTLRPTA